ncbi:hypothetical protein Ancab_036266 [Ancistrocladus abbreviatus]
MGTPPTCGPPSASSVISSFSTCCPPSPLSPLPHRLAGLMTNRMKLMFITGGETRDDDNLARIRDGARAMAMARAMRDGNEWFDGGDYEMEEAVLCLVLTNAVEVQVNGEGPQGIGVYNTCFSWINHSCSPNSCYYLVVYSEALARSDQGKMRIGPNGDEILVEDDGVCKMSKLAKVCNSHGPQMIVRSIKNIEKSEEVTITYTDLLQPTKMRQSELWLKYQFFCSCPRCNAVPQTYVDYCLQETFSPNLKNANNDVHGDDGIGKLRDYFNSIVAEYMLVGNPVSCCQKIESMLMLGLADEQLARNKGSSAVDFRLSPLHHLALNAYTTLCSAFKVRAAHHVSSMQSEAFNMSKASTAYCMVLAGATHHLFLCEPSLIASAGIFWTSAGESLLCLARSSFWNALVPNLSYGSSHKCINCQLLDKFEAKFYCTQTQNAQFDEISSQFLNCVSIITPMVWSFLVQGCNYLKDIVNPINFNWLKAMRASYVGDSCTQSCCNELFSSHTAQGNIIRYNEQGPASNERMSLFQLGVHCLLYGGYLSGICYGHSHATWYINKLLDG